MIDAPSELKRGLLWFGSATLFMRLLDLGALLVLLQMLTRQDMGRASIAWSVAVVFEAFNGLGVGSALVQTKELSRREVDSLFWFSCMVGCVFAGLMMAAAPLIAHLYREPELELMLFTGAAKLVFVGAALVPLQLLARDLRFRGTGAVQTGATALEATTKIVLALSGAGAWSLVIANAARGLYALLMVYLLAPYFPKLQFRFADVRRFLSFGLRNMISNAVFYAYKNADYFFLGRYLGLEVLGVYRVAFDVAMTPLEIVIQIVNRVAFPVYSRIADDARALSDAFTRSCRYLFLLLGPAAVLLFFGAEDALKLLAHARWQAAVPAAQLLCWAALLRGLAQLFPQLFYALGRAEYAVYDALLSLFTLAGGFWLALELFSAKYGMLSVCWVWLLAYPILLGALGYWTKRIAGVQLRSIVKAVLPVLGGLLVMALPLALVSSLHLQIGALGRVGTFLVVGLSTYALYLRVAMGVRLGDLRP